MLVHVVRWCVVVVAVVVIVVVGGVGVLLFGGAVCIGVLSWRKCACVLRSINTNIIAAAPAAASKVLTQPGWRAAW